MICSCGGDAPFKEHEVLNASTAFEWTGIKFSVSQMPVMIGRNVCSSCGRQSKTTVRFSNQNKTKGE